MTRRVAGKRLMYVEFNSITDLLGDDLGWVNDSALCAQTDPQLWFPPKGGDPVGKELCAACPLRDPCGRYALTHDVWGVWGGTSRKQRLPHMNLPEPRSSEEVVRPAPSPRPPDCPVGSTAGARRHYRRGERACQPCNDARTAAEVALRERRKREAA